MTRWILIGGEPLGNDLFVAQNLIDYGRDFIINPDEIYGLLEDRTELNRLRNKINFIDYKLGKGWVEGLYSALCKVDSDD